MKILVAIPCLLTGGTEIQTLSLVEAAVAAGHSVAVAVYFEHSEAMRARYERAGARVMLLSPDGSRPDGVVATARFLWRGLRRAVRELCPDLAHVQYMAPGAMPVVILKALGVRRILATAHTSGDIYSPRGLKLVKWLVSNCLSGFQCITLRAEEAFFGPGSAALFNPSAPPRSHFTIYNTLPSYISIAPVPRRFDSGAPLTIGVVSRLEAIKGMDLVVPAFAQICRGQNDAVKLLIVGDGSLRRSMERQAVEHGVADAVEFAGRQGQDTLQTWYDRIDLLLMPSRSEGFGLTAIEAMARGAVVVASDTGGLPEVVTPEVGILCTPGSVEALAAATITLLAEGPRSLAARSAAALSRVSAFAPVTYRATIAALLGAISQKS